MSGLLADLRGLLGDAAVLDPAQVAERASRSAPEIEVMRTLKRALDRPASSTRAT
jgi:hypothetical protein